MKLLLLWCHINKTEMNIFAYYCFQFSSIKKTKYDLNKYWIDMLVFTLLQPQDYSVGLPCLGHEIFHGSWLARDGINQESGGSWPLCLGSIKPASSS